MAIEKTLEMNYTGNEKIYEVHYFKTYSTSYCYERDLKFYKQDIDYGKHEQIKGCRRCGDQTEKLEIINNHPSCKDCGEKSEQSMKRAYDYMANDSDY